MDDDHMPSGSELVPGDKDRRLSLPSEMVDRGLELAARVERQQGVERHPPTIEQSKYVSLEELYRNAPANSTEQTDWIQWENRYKGRYVKGKGRVNSVSIHPREGKLFLIATTFGEEGTIENSKIQVALLVEDAHTVALGEEEGSFLIDGTKWVQLGCNYAFQGRVSEYSRLDVDLLVSSGQGTLVVIRVMKKEINRE
jgi:hypothetical protein